MYVSSIPVICYYNINILRAETDVKFVGKKAVIGPLYVPIECTFEQLCDMIYSRTTIDKDRFKLVINCKYPLKSENRFQPFPIWDDNSVYRILNMVNTTDIEEIELYIEVIQVKPQVSQSMGGYGCGPSSGPVRATRVYEDDEDCAYEEGSDEVDEDVDDESIEDLDVQADGHVSPFHTFNQVLENKQRIYVSAHAASCDVTNNPDIEEPDESSPIHYHLPPTPQFEHVENLGNEISSGWTPWVHHTGYSSGEFVVGQVFNSKSDLQEAAKIYSIKAKEQNIGNYGYIGTWILRKFRKYRKISVDILTKISVMQKLTKIL